MIVCEGSCRGEQKKQTEREEVQEIVKPVQNKESNVASHEWWSLFFLLTGQWDERIAGASKEGGACILCVLCGVGVTGI